MSPHSNPYVNPLHVDDPEGDPPGVSANRLTPDSAAAYHPATHFLFLDFIMGCNERNEYERGETKSN